MAWEREERQGVGGAGGESVELRRDRRGDGVVASGTLSCPSCDAPTSPGRPVGLRDVLHCPWCAHQGPVRDFLSLGTPGRPARVVVRLR